MSRLNLAIKDVKMGENFYQNEILRMLLTRRDAWVSGESLARRLSISRVAVHKKIERLASFGFRIERKRRYGYRLVEVPNKPVPPLVEYEFEEKGIEGVDYHYFEEADSVQDIAVQAARKNAEDWAVFCASHQTAGRGRLGRNWVSPHGGLWMSVIFSPCVYLDKAAAISVASAYYVVDVLRSEYGIKAFVKWPNDIVLNEKKVGGILVTSISEGELIVKAVVGIGLNVNFESFRIGKTVFPASTILEETGKNLFLPELLTLIVMRMKYEMESALKDSAKLRERVEKVLWRRGQEVKLRMPDNSFISGRIKGLSDDCFLIFSTSQGEEKLFTGELV